jgi:hypothetical protein
MPTQVCIQGENPRESKSLSAVRMRIEGYFAGSRHECFLGCIAQLY